MMKTNSPRLWLTRYFFEIQKDGKKFKHYRFNTLPEAEKALALLQASLKRNNNSKDISLYKIVEIAKLYEP